MLGINAQRDIAVALRPFVAFVEHQSGIDDRDGNVAILRLHPLIRRRVVTPHGQVLRIAQQKIEEQHGGVRMRCAPCDAGALEACNGGTRVVWKGEAQIFGRLMSVAGGLLEPLAKKNVQKLIDGLQRSLESKEV